jgi:hypothetical protein
MDVEDECDDTRGRCCCAEIYCRCILIWRPIHVEGGSRRATGHVVEEEDAADCSELSLIFNDDQTTIVVYG